jgi:hypothetical protein
MKEPFPQSLPDPWGTTAKVLRFAAVICVLGSFAWFLAGAARMLWNTKVGHPSLVAPLPDPAKEIVDARDAGQYEKALQLAAEGLKSHPDLPQIRDLSDQLRRDIKPSTFGLTCVLHGKPLGKTHCETLTSADEFYVELDLTGVQPNSYAYLFLADSAGDWKVLLPNKTDPNPLPPFPYKVPDTLNFKGRLHPSATPGAEKVFLVIAWWRIPALEDLSAKLAAEKDPERARDLGLQIDTRLRLEFAKPDALKGLKHGQLEFNNSGKP